MTDPKKVHEPEPYERFQMERYGNVLESFRTTSDGDMMEPDTHNTEGHNRYVADQAERELHEYER